MPVPEYTVVRHIAGTFFQLNETASTDSGARFRRNLRRAINPEVGPSW